MNFRTTLNADIPGRTQIALWNADIAKKKWCIFVFFEGLKIKTPYTYIVWPRNEEHSCKKSWQLVKAVGRNHDRDSQPHSEEAERCNARP